MLFNGTELDIEQLAQRWFDVKRIQGNEIIAACPWDKHRKGQNKVYINIESGLWDCKACSDKSGDIITLARLMEDLDYVEALDWLQEKGGEIDFLGFSERIDGILHDEGRVERSQSALRGETQRLLDQCMPGRTGYWRDRGIRTSTIDRYNLLIRPGAPDGYKYIIPIYWKGKYRYFIKRASSDEVRAKYLYQRGLPRRSILYGLHIRDESDFISTTAVVCEGPLDVLVVSSALNKYHMYDYRAVAILGNRMTPEQMSLIRSEFNRVIMFLDNDEEGRRGQHSLADDLMAADVMPEYADYGASKLKVKDPGEMEEADIKRAIENSRLYVMEEDTVGATTH